MFKQHDRECQLSLVLFAYRTTVHSSTGMSPLGLMFGRASQTNSLQPETAFESESYQAHLKHKLAEIKGFVKLRSPFRKNARKRTMIVKQQSAPFLEVTPSGCQYQLQGSWIHDGKEVGLCSQSEVQLR